VGGGRGWNLGGWERLECGRWEGLECGRLGEVGMWEVEGAGMTTEWNTVGCHVKS